MAKVKITIEYEVKLGTANSAIPCVTRRETVMSSGDVIITEDREAKLDVAVIGPAMSYLVFASERGAVKMCPRNEGTD